MSKKNNPSPNSKTSHLAKNHERRNASAEQIFQDNEIFKYILNSLPGNIYYKDANGYYLGCNNNVAKVVGLSSPREIIGKRNQDLLSEKLAKQTNASDQIAIKSGKEYEFEEIGTDKNQNEAIYLSRKLPLKNAKGEVVGLLGVSLDITERKKMEQDLVIAKEAAEASDRAKSQFLAVMNHELRTPITSIIGLVDLLEHHPENEAQRASIYQKLRSCSEHLLGLVNNVLNFSRLESGKYEVAHETVDLFSLINNIKNIVQSLADKKGLALNIQIEENVPTLIYTDKMILQQILINLTNNALKFTSKGNVTLKISAKNMTSTEIILTFTVSDTGIGIPTDKLEKIFDPFIQVEDSYTRQTSQQGTGLGLAIVKKMSNLINASVEVTSELGKGSVFTITGTFTLATAEITSASTEKKLSPLHPGILAKKPLVLLIEDDPIVRYVHEHMVRDLGCDVDSTVCGKEGLEKLNGHDFLMVDVTLPDISGFEVIEEIRKQAKYSKLPILALTALTSEAEKNRCLTAGSNEFVTKPITHETLRSLLIQYLKHDGP